MLNIQSQVKFLPELAPTIPGVRIHIEIRFSATLFAKHCCTAGCMQHI